MSDRGNWGSKMGFVLAAAGSAVGLGNIWRFPYTASKSGGALFVLIYLVAVVAVALPVLLAEVSLGRFTAKNPVGAFAAIKARSPWKLVGFLGIATGVMILSYYAVVAGWTIGYFVKSITGNFKQILDSNGEPVLEKAQTLFNNFSTAKVLPLVLLAIFLFLTVYVISRGVSGGIEKFSKILMPVLFAILLLLLLRSLTLEGASKGLKVYLIPNFSQFEPKMILEALGQAFFSLSLGMGTMITYGSYVSKKENLPTSVGWIAFFDTGIAFIAGLIIIPAVFALGQGQNITAGPGLVFEVLPVIFEKMAGGVIFGPLFFLLLSIAALTSTISLLEVPVSYFVDEKKWNRKKTAVVVGAVTLVLGIPSALSPNKFLSTMNFIWGNLALSIGALFIAVFVGYVWKTRSALKEISEGSEKFRLAPLWVFSIKYITPIAILLILVVGILVLGITF